MKRAFFLLILFSSSILFNQTDQTLVMGQAAPDCAEPAGSITRETYYSGLLGQTMYYSVYTPPCYDSAQAYPAIYLMHGSNDDDGQWGRLGIARELDEGIASKALPPVLAILPFGNVIANRNRFDSVSWANIFLTELLPDAEAKYTVDGRRAIGGISRGGFWAYQLGLRHPELFSAIGGHSAFFDRYHAPPEFNPLDLVLTEPDAVGQRFWIDRGRDDFAFEGLDLMDTRLAERGLDYVYVVHPEGQHANSYWILHVGEYLRFYTADWLADSLAGSASRSTATTLNASLFVTNTPSAFVTNTPAAATAEAQGSPTPVPSATIRTTDQGADLNADAASLLVVPAVAFPSLQTSIDAQALDDLLAGQYEPRLIVATEIYELLLEAGLNPQTRSLPLAEMRNALWRDRQAFALLPFEALTLQMRMLWVDDRPIPDQLDTYPLLVALNPAVLAELPWQPFDATRLTRLTLSGVTALTRTTRSAIDQYGLDWAASGIRDYVRSSDFFHISNEVSFVEGCPGTIGQILLGGNSSMCSKPEHFSLLTDLGVDVVELSGNHNNDFGYEAYYQTLGLYREAAMRTVGGGASLAEARAALYLEHDGGRIAMLSCNMPGPYYAQVNEDPTLLGGIRPGAAACDWPWLEAELPRLAAEADLVVVSVQHFEYEEYLPTDAQRWDYRKLADLGADIVVGTAAHKPQTFDLYQTSRGTQAFIHYGLGNLFFDQPFWGNMRFFMDTVYLYDGRLLSVELFPGIIEENARPRLMTPDERINFLHFMFVQQNGL